MHEQFIPLAVVGVAVAYLGKQAWSFTRGKKTGGCGGGCGGCPAKSSAANVTLVSIQPSPPAKR